jgi:cob(I)alamin adenosyltransferase
MPGIYTRTGDDGNTALGSRERVAKDSLRVAAYGTVDELNSAIGLALAAGLSQRLAETLPGIQDELFHLGADLSYPEADKARLKAPLLSDVHIARLESLIDELWAIVGPLRSFILPGGSVGAAHLHLARTICRRAERAVVALARQEAIGPTVLPYLNRLSDTLFAMARYENHSRGVAEPLWNAKG